MAQARKASKINSKINMLLFGVPFSGKTTLGMQMAMLHTKEGRPFRVLVLDAEQGGADDLMSHLETIGVNLENIYLVYSQSLNEIRDYIRKAANHEDIYELDEDGNESETVVLDADGEPFHPDCILLDGSSVLKLTSQQSLLNLARRRAKVKANKNGLVGEEKILAIDDVALSPREWGALGYSGQSLVLDLAASNLHYIITAREKDVTENRLVNGKVESVATGEKTFDSFKNIDYNVKTIARLYRDPEEPDMVKMNVIKDRTGVFAPGQIVEDPSLLSFQSMIDNSNGTEVIIKNTMEKAIDIEGKLYEKSLGVEDEGVSEPTQSQPAPTLDAASLKKDIKANHSKMNPAQRAEFAGILKKNELPTAISKVDDASILNRIYEISKEVLE